MLRIGIQQLFSLVYVAAALLVPLSLHALTTSGEHGRLLDNLFVLQDNETARISSYDGKGGNFDFVRIARGETKIIAGISGTGASMSSIEPGRAALILENDEINSRQPLQWKL